jgi:hypothetical protein
MCNENPTTPGISNDTANGMSNSAMHAPPVNAVSVANNQVGRGRRQALGSHAQHEIFSPRYGHDLLLELKYQQENIKNHLLAKLNNGLKWYIVVQAEFSKMDRLEDGTLKVAQTTNFLSSPTFTAYNTMDFDQDVPTALQELFKQFDEQERQQSGWTFEKIVQLEVHTATLEPLQASSYIATPITLRLTKGVLNIKNTQDEKCFLWSVLAHLHPVVHGKNANRITKYEPFLGQLNTEGLTFPTPLTQIPGFEKKNNLCINVFGWEKDALVPLQINRVESATTINLLLISDNDNRHYCLIKDFSRVMSYRTRHNGQKYFCMNCLHGFQAQALLDKHREVCTKQRAQRLSFPDETDVKFKSIAKQQRAPFCIYADFECCTKPQAGDKYQHRQVNSFACIVVSQ